MWPMKRDRKKPAKKGNLTLAKESVRKLAEPDLTDVAGGGDTIHGAKTVTFPFCCRTA